MDSSSSFRLAHLSDLHFSKVDKDFKQFFSKRWIGNLNFLLRRKKDFDYTILNSMPSLLQKEKVQLVLLSGDLTCTSSDFEFRMASEFTQKLQAAGLEVAVIPGNHDHYTKESYRKKTFYEFFSSAQGSHPWNLKKDRLSLKQLSKEWWLILLDTTLATPLLCSHGNFSSDLEKSLEEALKSIPPNSHVIIANHFPIDRKKWRPALQRKEAFLNLLKRHPEVKCYLHGHDHQSNIIDLREQGLPIAVDSGSSTHSKSGSWSLLECKPNSCSFTPFLWKNEWEPQTPKQFTW